MSSLQLGYDSAPGWHVATFRKYDSNGNWQCRRASAIVCSQNISLLFFHILLMCYVNVCSENSTLNPLFFCPLPPPNSSKETIIPGVLWVGSGNSEWLTQENDTLRKNVSDTINHCLYGQLFGTGRNEWKFLENDMWERCTGVSLYFLFMLNSVSNNHHAE